MLPWTALALLALYIGYVAYEAAQARERARTTPRPPDPYFELERVNEELLRLARDGRERLESARDAMHKGLRG